VSNMNSTNNRAVWFDIPVADLDRAAAYYRAALGIAVHKTESNGFEFCVLDHGAGNGGCLIPKADEAGAATGILLYLNVDGRIRDAVSRTPELGGRVLEPTHAIGPHGFRAVVLDSEGNRIALHSTVDA
jgi:predicted enzyme related to lactoylglutathione lyase